MTLKRLALTASAAIALAAGPAVAHPGHAPIPPAQASFSGSPWAPFELFRGQRIVLQGTVNGRPTEMMLDSGAGMTVIDKAFAVELGLRPWQTIQVQGAAGGVPGEIDGEVTLKAAGLQLDKLNVLSLDLAPIQKAIGRKIPLILGRDAFKAGTVEIDFPARKLRFLPQASFRPPADAVRIPLGEMEALPSVKVSINGGAPIDAHLDLGNGGTVLLSKAFWSADPALSALRGAEAQVGGIGGLKPARRVTIPKVSFGGVEFTNVPATLNEDASALPTSGGNIGIEMLRSFAVIFDTRAGNLYLVPKGPPYIGKERAGLRTELDGDHLHVAYVSPDGPAAAAGLKAGDEITAVAGKPVGLDYYSAPDWTRADAGTVIRLSLANGRTAVVKLADYY
jgi:hypothetical protein